MTPERFQVLAARYANLRVAVVGDFCLDRYLEIDPTHAETSIETGLAVHNVVNVRAQPGGAGTILNNLVALGVGAIYPLGFAGVDGEGFELVQALRSEESVRMDCFTQTPGRRTFTYCKPILTAFGKAPIELSRLDSKNWTPTPKALQDKLSALLLALSSAVDAIILLDQVDVPETGVITKRMLGTVAALAKARPGLLVVADSRRGLKNYPPICLKMNRAEFAALTAVQATLNPSELKAAATQLAKAHGEKVFVTLAEAGIVGAAPDGHCEYSNAWPVRGEIDVVGAGDAVTANLAAGLAAGASLKEALDLANAAASIVVHKLGTTGAATLAEISSLFTQGHASATSG